MSDIKPFGAKEDLFNQDTFFGRFNHFTRFLSPYNLLFSNDQLIQFQKNIDDHTATGKSKYSDKELWEQKYAVSSCMHPETKTPLQMPFRWSCFVPCNIPLLFGIGLLPPTPFNQAFFQSMNQAYNFGINVCNASASNPMSNRDISISFTLAISSALGVSVGFRKLLLNIKSKNNFVRGLLQLTPYFGVCVASTVNLFFSRFKDLQNGIEVMDPKSGEKIENLRSIKCGQKAFGEALFVRWFLPIPAMLLPSVISTILTKKFTFYRSNKKLGFFCDVLICYFSLVVGVNGAQALFHPIGSLRYGDLEKEVQKQLPDINCEDHLIKFNKGL